MCCGVAATPSEERRSDNNAPPSTRTSLDTAKTSMTLLRTSAGKCQQPILHVLDKRLAAPAGELPANSEGTALAGGAAGQLDQINHLVQHGARLLGVVLEDEGRREVSQDHRLVLLLAGTEAPGGLLKRCLGACGVVQAKMAS